MADDLSSEGVDEWCGRIPSNESKSLDSSLMMIDVVESSAKSMQCTWAVVVKRVGLDFLASFCPDYN
jgi:hypothetical protein